MKNKSMQLLKHGFFLLFTLLSCVFVFAQTNKNTNKLKKSNFDKLHKLQKEDIEPEFNSTKIPE